MAMDYDFSVDTTMTVAECKKLLTRELGLQVSPQRPDRWLVDAGTTVTVNAMDERSPGMRLCREVYGFVPRLGITMRPVMSLESGFVTIMGVVDLMLRSTQGDAGFSLEIERVLLLRRQGEVSVREDFRRHMSEQDLLRISVPYRFKALKP